MAIDAAVANMRSLRTYIASIYPYGRPNFFIPQSLLDAFARLLIVVFSLGEQIWPQECSVKLDSSLPVNISPFDHDLSSYADPGPLLDSTQDICQLIAHGFKNAKLELLVGLMFRPELPILTRTTTYEVADGEALLMLVIEHISLNIQHGNSIDLVKDCNDALVYLVCAIISIIKPKANL